MLEDNKWTREEFQELVHRLEETPNRVRSLVEGLTPDDGKWKPSEDEFSALENVCHLKDIEEEGYSVRIRRLMEESEPFLKDVDGARLARERDYQQQDMKEMLGRFTAARGENVRAVRDLPLDQLARHGTFEGVGPVTLGRLLLMMREHDEGHLEELEALNNRLA